MSWIFLCMLLITIHRNSSAEKCLKSKLVSTIKRHFKLYEDSWSLLPLKLSYSRRPSHQISTQVLRILLEEILGYEDVVLVPDNSGLSVDKALQKLTGCKNYSCQSSAVPDVMVNTEVWVPPGYHVNQWVDRHLVDTAGIIADHGRFGWYMPTDFVQTLWHDSRIVADHWKAFELQSVSGQLIQNLTAFQSHLSLSELKELCEKIGNCHHGIYYGSRCDPRLGSRATQCAVLLTDYSDHYGFVVSQQINNLDLNVSVAWLGSKLEQVMSMTDSEPFLTLNWEPNTMTRNRQLTRIALPLCSPNVSFITAMTSKLGPFNCDFPHSHLQKFAWGKVKQNSPDVYHTLSRMYFDRNTMNDLLSKHKNGGGNLTSQEVACDWLEHSKDVWLPWLPSESFNSRIPVYLGGMFPLSTSDDAVWSRPGILHGALMALERINEDLTILSNYNLELVIEDTQCRTALTLDAFIKFMSRSHNETIVGILGPACSLQTEIIVEVAPLYNTVAMGYSVEGTSLADREKYPLFFRTSSSHGEYTYAYAAVFDYFDWKQVASLTDTNYDTSTITMMHEYLEDRGMHLAYSRLITNEDSIDIKTYLTSLKDSSAKIIIATLYESLARMVICEAFQQDMTPQNGYVWFLPSWLADNWWHIDPMVNHGHSSDEMLGIICSHDNIQQFVSGGYFSLSIAFYGPDKSMVQGGGTVEQWKEEYKKRVNRQDEAASGYASFLYDAVWTYAIALDKLFKNHPAALDTIHTNSTTQLFMTYLQQTNFTGVSGRVIFRDGERYLPTVEMNQHFTNRVVMVGRVVPDTLEVCEGNRGCLQLKESYIEWPGGSRPFDGRQEPSAQELCSVESFRASLGTSCSEALTVINAIAIGLFLVVVIICIWIFIKRRYDRKYKETQQRMEELGLMEQSPILHLDEWEIPRDNIVLNRKLGEGAFGAVCGGEVIGVGGEKEWVPVAVKALKPGSLPEEKLEFLSEAETMKSFDHKNIVKLVGVCTKGEPALAVMELMIHGDLKSFLLARRQFANRDCKEAEDVTPRKLTTMAFDITSGLVYLADMKFVHRDLALRNCMVGSGYVVKLGDFGMARAMYESDYYRFGRRAMLPVRWMAPESLSDGVFTTKSDVWSLGVTLWELATFGSFPYRGLSNGEVVEKVKLGQTMNTPHDCTDKLEALLTGCWRKDPVRRPEPSTIIDLLVTHSAMVTACLDSPMSSVATDDDCVGPRDVRRRGTASPSLGRSRTVSKLPNEQLKILKPVRDPIGSFSSGVQKQDESSAREDTVC